MRSDRIFITHFTLAIFILASLIRGELTLSLAFLFIGIFLFFQIFPKTIRFVRTFAHFVGQFNTAIVLGLTFFLIFTPFGFIYRLFFSSPAFKKSNGQWVKSNPSCNFDVPF